MKYAKLKVHQHIDYCVTVLEMQQDYFGVSYLEGKRPPFCTSLWRHSTQQPPIDWGKLSDIMREFMDARDKKDKAKARRSGVDILSEQIIKDIEDFATNPPVFDGPKMPRAWHDELDLFPYPSAFYEMVDNLKGYNIFSGLEYFKLNGDPDWMTPGYEVEMRPAQIYVDESFYSTPSHWQIFKRWIINLYRHALHNRKRSDK